MWRDRKHHLDRMTLGELTVAYFQYPAIKVYITLLVIASFLTFHLEAPEIGHLGLSVFLAVVAALLVYPLVWYLLHRFVLHGQFLYRSPNNHKAMEAHPLRPSPGSQRLAGFIWRLADRSAHYRSRYPSTWFPNRRQRWCCSSCGGSDRKTLFYEYCHCVRHIRYAPRNAFLQRIKPLHLLHHFHNENGNFGITNFFWDRVGCTYYPRASDVPRSMTVFNLGYADEECTRYP